MKGYQTKINEILKEKNKLLIKLKVRLKLVKKKKSSILKDIYIKNNKKFANKNKIKEQKNR